RREPRSGPGPSTQTSEAGPAHTDAPGPTGAGPSPATRLRRVPDAAAGRRGPAARTTSARASPGPGWFRRARHVGDVRLDLTSARRSPATPARLHPAVPAA